MTTEDMRTDRALSWVRGYVLLLGVAAVLYLSVFAITYAHAIHTGVSAEGYVVATGDSSEYVALARTMLAHGRYALSASAPAEEFRTPGYPLFIAILLFAGRTILVLPVAQIALLLGTLLLIARIGEKWLSRTVGFAAAALYALEPTVIAHTMVALSETLFVFLFVLSTYVLLPARSPGRAALAGAVFGLSVLVRPAGFFAMIVFVLWLAWQLRGNLRDIALCVAALLLGTALVISPWLARNEIAGGHFTISTISSFNPLFYNVVTFEASRRHVPESAVRDEIFKALGTQDPALLRSAAFSAPERRLAWQYLSAHPIRYLAFHLVKTVPFFLGSGISSDLALAHMAVAGQDTNISGLVLSGHIADALRALASTPAVFAETLFWILTNCLCLLSLAYARLYRKPFLPFALFCIAIVAGFALITGPIAMPRYRLPAEPFMFLLACTSVYVFRDFYTARVKTKNL